MSSWRCAAAPPHNPAAPRVKRGERGRGAASLPPLPPPTTTYQAWPLGCRGRRFGCGAGLLMAPPQNTPPSRALLPGAARPSSSPLRPGACPSHSSSPLQHWLQRPHHLPARRQYRADVSACILKLLCRPRPPPRGSPNSLRTPRASPPAAHAPVLCLYARAAAPALPAHSRWGPCSRGPHPCAAARDAVLHTGGARSPPPCMRPPWPATLYSYPSGCSPPSHTLWPLWPRRPRAAAPCKVKG
jgi:hypothetical protein